MLILNLEIPKDLIQTLPLIRVTIYNKQQLTRREISNKINSLDFYNRTVFLSLDRKDLRKVMNNNLKDNKKIYKRSKDS